MKPFCEQLSEVRKRKGITQDDLASKMHLTRQAVSRWENGRSLPDVETMIRLSQVLSYNFFKNEAIPPAQDEAPAPEAEQAGEPSEDLAPIIHYAPPREKSA